LKGENMNRPTMILTATVLCVSMLAGCAQQEALSMPEADFSSLATSEAEAARIRESLTDGDIARLLDANVTAKLPTPLAVAKLTCSHYLTPDTIDAAELAGWEKAIAEAPGITGICPVSPLLLNTSERATLHDLRAAAARMNCEMLLVYLQTDGSVSNYNDAAVLYWTLVGLFVVPGTEYQHRTVMQAMLLDTRTGMVLGTASGDAHLTRLRPAAMGSAARDQMREEAPAKALADLQKAAGGMFSALAPAPRIANGL
jgi:hypothetical protein